MPSSLWVAALIMKNMHFKLTKYMMNKMPDTSSGDHACLFNWIAADFVRES
jgi:hypothetical protein